MPVLGKVVPRGSMLGVSVCFGAGLGFRVQGLGF